MPLVLRISKLYTVCECVNMRTWAIIGGFELDSGLVASNPYTVFKDAITKSLK